MIEEKEDGCALAEDYDGILNGENRVVAGTVKGDLHDIGKNLVCMMLEGAVARARALLG